METQLSLILRAFSVMYGADLKQTSLQVNCMNLLGRKHHISKDQQHQEEPDLARRELKTAAHFFQTTSLICRPLSHLKFLSYCSNAWVDLKPGRWRKEEVQRTQRTFLSFLKDGESRTFPLPAPGLT